MIGEVLDYQTREAWLASRRTAIGASEVAALFGLSPWDTRVSLWAKKTGRIVEDGTMPEHVEWGNLLEPAIATRYEQVTRRKTMQLGSPYCVAQHATIPFLRCTPDRWVVESPDRAGAGLVQIKNTNAFTGHDWDEEGPPLFIQVQVQAEMSVTGRDWDSVAALIGGCKFRTTDVERNQDFIDEMEEQVRVFWGYVERDEMPPLDGTPRTLEVIKKLHPLDNGQTVQLDAAALAQWQELEAAKALRKAAEARETAAETELWKAIGDATFGKLPDGRILSLRTSQNPGREAAVVEPYTYRVLRFSKKDQPTTKGRRS